MHSTHATRCAMLSAALACSLSSMAHADDITLSRVSTAAITPGSTVLLDIEAARPLAQAWIAFDAADFIEPTLSSGLMAQALVDETGSAQLLLRIPLDTPPGFEFHARAFVAEDGGHTTSNQLTLGIVPTPSAAALFNGSALLTGNLPLSVAVGDLNGDSWNDIVSAFTSPAGIHVFLNDQTGGYGPATLLPGRAAMMVTLGDVNDDGVLDVVNTALTGDVVVQLGKGDGTFGPTVSTEGMGFHDVALSDMDGDGHVDVVTANAYDGGVVVAHGRGDGSFGTPMFFEAGGGCQEVDLGDLNGDGRVDIVAANVLSNSISVLLGSVEGMYAPAVHYLMLGATDITITEVSGDDIPDLAVTSTTLNGIMTWNGVGDGTFEEGVLHNAGQKTNKIESYDLDDDGKQELIATSELSGETLVFKSTSDGLFKPLTYGVGSKPRALAVADMGDDAIADIVVSNSWSHTISILVGEGDATFSVPDSVAFEPSTLGGFAYGDINDDGRPDLAISMYQGIMILLGSPGEALFKLHNTIYELDTVIALKLADVDGDGVDDLVTTYYLASVVRVRLGVGDGTFGEPTTSTTAAYPTDLAVGDFNDDGAFDVVTVHANDVSVLLSLGNGTLGPPTLHSVGFVPTDVVIFDADGDGLLDIATVNWIPKTITFLYGFGDGSFAPKVKLKVGSFMLRIASGDMNGDGHTDLVIAQTAPNAVLILLGDGAGTYGDVQSYPASVTPDKLVVCDLNGDGTLDIATASNVGTPTVLLGLGGREFSPQAHFDGGLECRFLAAIDVTEDGKLDLVVSNGYYGKITVLANQQ